jgi:hypothetical protein
LEKQKILNDLAHKRFFLFNFITVKKEQKLTSDCGGWNKLETVREDTLGCGEQITVKTCECLQ